MFSSVIHAPCEISLHLVSEDIFIHPPPPNSDLPGEDQTLRGVVELRAPSERTIPALRVQLQALQTLSLPEPVAGAAAPHVRHEEKVLLDKTIEITSDGSGGLSHAHRIGKGKGKARESPAVSPMGGPSDGFVGELAEDGIHLDKGLHGFEFSFIIPSSSPPFERYRHGRVRYVVTATALGAGRGRSAVSIWREVFVIVQATPDGGPVPLDIQYHDVHEALGPLSVSLTSASLTVGGTATLSILHPDPPPGLSVHVIRVFLEQTVELYSDLRKGWLKLPVEKMRLWEKGYMPYKAKQPEPHLMPEDAFWLAQSDDAPGRPGRAAHAYQGPAAHSSFSPFSPGSPLGRTAGTPSNSYRVKATVRMPDDNAIRPSTVRGSRSDIRISHDLGVEVYFSRLSVIDEREHSESRGKPKVQVFSMRRSTVIPSCCCTFDTIHLPPYSFESPSNSRPSSPTPPTSRNPTQADVDHWRLAQTLRAALPHASGPVTHAPPSRSAPGSRPASRDASPTRPHLPHSGGSFSAFLHGRRSRNSSPERAAGSPGPSHHGELSSSAPSRRGRSGLTFTPAHAGAAATSTSVTTAPASGTNTPRSLPSSYPWANSHLPPRTPGGHQTCNCGRTTEELTEAEQRLLGGAPTAPGAWIDAHEEGSEPPPWTPSRPSSPSEGLHSEPFGERSPYLREKAPPCPA